MFSGEVAGAFDHTIINDDLETAYKILKDFLSKVSKAKLGLVSSQAKPSHGPRLPIMTSHRPKYPETSSTPKWYTTITYRTRNLADIFEMLVTFGKSFNSNCCSPNNLSVSVENRFSFKISSPRWLVYVLPCTPC